MKHKLNLALATLVMASTTFATSVSESAEPFNETNATPAENELGSTDHRWLDGHWICRARDHLGYRYHGIAYSRALALRLALRNCYRFSFVGTCDLRRCSFASSDRD